MSDPPSAKYEIKRFVACGPGSVEGSSMLRGNTWVSMEENEKSRIYIDPESTSDNFCYIYKSKDHHDHLEK